MSAIPRDMLDLPAAYTLAVPSWVIPGTVYENAIFLAGACEQADGGKQYRPLVDAVSLLCMESASSLAYTAQDLPAILAELPLRWHVHLPVDLPATDAVQAFSIIARLMAKLQFLRVRQAVLHPPVGVSSVVALRWVDSIAKQWVQAGYLPCDLLLENILGNDLIALVPAFHHWNLGFCLDMGHAMAYEQLSLLEQGALTSRLAMLHVNVANAVGACHQPLTADMPETTRIALQSMFAFASPEVTLVLELFDWKLIASSLPHMQTFLMQSNVKTLAPGV